MAIKGMKLDTELATFLLLILLISAVKANVGYVVIAKSYISTFNQTYICQNNYILEAFSIVN